MPLPEEMNAMTIDRFGGLSDIIASSWSDDRSHTSSCSDYLEPLGDTGVPTITENVYHGITLEISSTREGNHMTKTLFITGAGRGLGLEIGRAALNAGDTVVATARSGSLMCPTHIEVR